ncbi:MAG: TraB/GumN family protein [Micropepsaceae bacterium]
MQIVSVLHRVVIAFLVAFSLPYLTSAGTAHNPAKPAFWIVEHNGKTLYLLGSVHLLPPELKWERPEIEAARARSQVFVFEAPLKDAETVMARFVEQHGKLPAGKTLRDVMSVSDFDAMEEAAWAVQYPPKLLQPVRPWLAAVYLELYSYLKDGYSPYYGVDQVIEREAEKKGAGFAYFETVEEQLSYFLRLTPAEERKYLNATVKDIRQQPDLPKQLIDAWAAGDTEKLSEIIETGMASVPQLKAQLLVARNRKWLPQIIDMVKSDKTHFVTVGAGHLIGRDGVVAMLRAKGYRVTGP